MKKWIATILSISLVIGMAAVLHACGKPKDEPQTTATQEQSESVTGESVSETKFDLSEDVSNMLGEIIDPNYSYTEVSTNEHYQEEYDALTLPTAVTTQPVAGTTKPHTTTNPAVRETTTAFQFTSPSRTQTTKPSGGSTKPSGETTTTRQSAATTQPAEPETTMLADVVGSNVTPNVQDATVMPRPQVTYLDKYVVDILQSGSYTAEMEMTEEGMTMSITTYVDGDDWASEIPIGSMLAQEMGMPASMGVGKMRFIIKDMKSNPKAYIVLPTGNYMEMNDIAEAAEMMAESGAQNLRQQMQLDKLQYCGKTTGVGYVCETYILPEDNIRYDFYFAQTDGYTGLVRWDVSDLSSNAVEEHVVMRLYKGVSNKKAFTVTGKKMDPEELAGMFGG